jgi:hypothetical protein
MERTVTWAKWQLESEHEKAPEQEGLGREESKCRDKQGA